MDANFAYIDFNRYMERIWNSFPPIRFRAILVVRLCVHIERHRA